MKATVEPIVLERKLIEAERPCDDIFARIHRLNGKDIKWSRLHGKLPELASYIFWFWRPLMTSELAGALKALTVDRARLQKELANLDKAISILRKLSVVTPSPSGRRRKRVMSAAARRKIAKAQKLRWAKVRKARAGKA